MSAAPLLELDRLEAGFVTIDGPVQVLRGVSLRVGAGERVAIVGESGSGKSVTVRAILGLLPDRITTLRGAIRFEGRNLLGLSPHALRALRGRALTMIFQDPVAALNPMFTIRDQFASVLQRSHAGAGRAALESMMAKALEEVAIHEPGRVLDSYSFQLSGGLNQRVMIAMALANQPRLVLADEPGTALDVTVQEQTLRLMRRLSEQHSAAILFISHNLGVVRNFAHRVAVMYAGRIVEEAPVDVLFAHPRHPYTRALLGAVPSLSARSMPVWIDGEVPDMRTVAAGCAFRPRCTLAAPRCAAPVEDVAVTPEHRVACTDPAALVQ